MVDHTLEIQADNQPTVLERVLQVTRYRGFVVTGLLVNLNDESDELEIKLAISDPKESLAEEGVGFTRLYNQLNKLFDIKHVNLTKKTNT